VKAVVDVDALVVQIIGEIYICELPLGNKVFAYNNNKTLSINRGDIVAIVSTTMSQFKTRHEKVLYRITTVRHDLIWGDVLK